MKRRGFAVAMVETWCKRPRAWDSDDPAYVNPEEMQRQLYEVNCPTRYSYESRLEVRSNAYPR